MAEMTASTLDKEELRRTVADVLDVDVSDVTDDAHFVNDLEVDSLIALEVMVVLERKYHVKLVESELREVTTLDRAYSLLAGKLRDRG